jgi:hypothetical protein
MQHIPVDRPLAAKPIVIEVGGEPQGIVVPHGDLFRFVAVRLPVFSIDGVSFESIEAARIAASTALLESAA